MKVNFDPDRSEWSLPESELNTALTKAIHNFELEKSTQAQNRRFWLSLTYCTASVIGASAIIILGGFSLFPVIVGGMMYGASYEVLKTYLQVK